MAEVVSEEHGVQKPVAPAEEIFFRHRQREMVVNQRRFGLAYLVLAVAVGVAVGLGIVLIGRSSSHHKTTGVKSFHPTASGELGAKQIAAEVGVKYRQPNGQPLTAVVGERPNYQGAPLSYYLIRPHDAQYPKDVGYFPVGNGIMYSMCAFSASCTTTAAGNDLQENLLLKREALELSLNTFKFDGSVQTVTTLLPPFRQGQNLTTFAIIFTRRELARWIHRPMSSLLTKRGPIEPGQIPNSESERINSIEAGTLFTVDPALGPDGNPYFRLDPVP
jgi:hypothetical protein